jgi:UDP-N-acetylglucosamine 2-epimerase (non-hydrolysing)
MKKILTIFGTRPEAIKMAPLISELHKSSEINCMVCVTGQHKEMLYQVLDLFEIVPDYDLMVMTDGQSLSELTAKIILSLPPIIEDFYPDAILVHGDTTSTLASSLAGYYQQIPVLHIEAGLRTDNIYSPWPEEINRRVTSTIAQYHFAPTVQAKSHLLKEGVPEERIGVTGNTVIDALFMILNRISDSPSIERNLQKNFDFLDAGKKLLLVTGHRRENFGEGFQNICFALKELASERSDIEILYPVHLNPNVLSPVKEIIGTTTNIHLIEPQDYLSFAYLMNRSEIILTDSGGIQEEAPSLGKPVLVLRDNTERPEALAAGTVLLVGTNRKEIIKHVNNLLDDPHVYESMSQATNPYGNGHASQKILSTILKSTWKKL